MYNQSFTDYELILVDDGSTDNCGEICDEYVQKYTRVSVVHKKNGGLSDARNAGMLVAKGEYIIFLDGDDYMADSAIGNAMAVIKENKGLDIGICPIIRNYYSGKEIINLLPIKNTVQLLNREMMLSKMMESGSVFWGAGENIYRRAIIEDYKLLFKAGLIGAEDCDFFMRFIRFTNKFCFINIPIVHYRLGREGSITNVMSQSAIIGQLQVFYENYFTFRNDEKLKNHNMQTYFANKFANAISILYRLDTRKDIIETISYIKSHKQILKFTKGIKYSIAKLIWLLLGYIRALYYFIK